MSFFGVFFSGKTCGSAGEVENGHVDYSNGNEFGDKIVITCNPGLVINA